MEKEFTDTFELKDKKCIPCSGGMPPLSANQIESLRPKIDEQWQLTHASTRLWRSFKFKDFALAIEFARQLGVMAEEQWHHPELHVGFGHCDVEIWTHKINNLVESDFIFAAKVDAIFKQMMA